MEDGINLLVTNPLKHSGKCLYHILQEAGIALQEQRIGYRPDSAGFESPASATDFSVFQNFITGSGAHPASCKWLQRFFPRVKKRTGREVYNLSLPNAKVKNEGRYTYTLPVYLHGVDEEKFTFLPTSLIFRNWHVSRNKNDYSNEKPYLVGV